MSSTYGTMLRLSIFGQSHGAAIGMTLGGIPAGLPVDREALNRFLARRAPGQNAWSTPRKEADAPEFLSGLVNGRTCGAPIAAIIPNTNTRSGDYQNLLTCPRPGHADYTAQVKYGGFQDVSGGGHFSGRLTAPLCVAGGLCLQWLAAQDIRVFAHILRIGPVEDAPLDPIAPDASGISSEFPVVDREKGRLMQEEIQKARNSGDSVGGVIQCAVTGLPAGLGEPMFGGMEGRIARILYGIPAVKGVEFGAGFAVGSLRGSENNDPFRMENGQVRTATNHCGGILGGITTGMPLMIQLAVKPTPSISLPQRTVDLTTGQETTLRVQGRHDPCIVPRAVPVVEAAVAIALYDAILEAKARR